MSFSVMDLGSMLKRTVNDFMNTLFEIYFEGHTFTLIIICGISLILSIQFIRYVWKSLFESQPIEDLLHFKAAPAGDRAAVISIQGQRKYMEDTYQAIPNLTGHANWSYYGVYDGHGGAPCSVYVAHYLHKHVLAWIDAYIAHYSSNSQRLINELLNNNENNTNGDRNQTENNELQIKNENENENEYKNVIENKNVNDNNNNNDNKNKKKETIPQCIVKIMNEILLKSHRKADQEFLQLANRQRWKDGSTSVCCLLLPANDLIKSLICNNNNNNNNTTNGDDNKNNNKKK
eukprot:832557_1